MENNNFQKLKLYLLSLQGNRIQFAGILNRKIRKIMSCCKYKQRLSATDESVKRENQLYKEGKRKTIEFLDVSKIMTTIKNVELLMKILLSKH